MGPEVKCVLWRPLLKLCRVGGRKKNSFTVGSISKHDLIRLKMASPYLRHMVKT